MPAEIATVQYRRTGGQSALQYIRDFRTGSRKGDWRQRIADTIMQIGTNGRKLAEASLEKATVSRGGMKKYYGLASEPCASSSAMWSTPMTTADDAVSLTTNLQHQQEDY